MEGQRNQEFSKEPTSIKDAFGDANRLKRYALSALRHIEKESKRHPQSKHPISYLGGIAGNRDILQFLYDNHQELALEHDGRRVTYFVIKDPEDPEGKRLIIQGLGFNRVRGRTIDIEWLKQYGSMEDKHTIKELSKLTRQDVIRSFRRAIVERYDPNKYKNDLSFSGAINLGINKIAEVSGARAISGTVSDTIADQIADRNYKIQKRKKSETPSDRLRREKRKGVMKKVTSAVGGALAAASIVGSAGVYEHQHPGTVGEIIQSVSQGLHHEQKAGQATLQETPTPESLKSAEATRAIYKQIMDGMEQDGAKNGYYFVDIGRKADELHPAYRAFLLQIHILDNYHGNTFIILTEDGSRARTMLPEWVRKINDSIKRDIAKNNTGDPPRSSRLEYHPITRGNIKDTLLYDNNPDGTSEGLGFSDYESDTGIVNSYVVNAVKDSKGMPAKLARELGNDGKVTDATTLLRDLSPIIGISQLSQ